MAVTTDIIQVGPNKAHELLALNKHNRHLNQGKVDQYAGAMKRGEWMLNGEGILFAKDGTLLNGQHRLSAVIQAGVTIRFLAVYGLEPNAQETMDQHKKRSLGDMLKLRGEQNTANLAGAINVLYTYSKVGTLYSGSLRPQPTPQQLLGFFENHQDIRDASYPPHGDFTGKLLTPSTQSAMYYLFKLVDPYDANEFFETLATAHGLQEGNPIFALRERLIRERAKAQGQISPTVRAALAVKAFNLWREGRKVYTLKWTGGGGRPEPFPRVQDCPLVPEVDTKS